jgi:hypothetical protein
MSVESSLSNLFCNKNEKFVIFKITNFQNHQFHIGQIQTGVCLIVPRDSSHTDVSVTMQGAAGDGGNNGGPGPIGNRGQRVSALAGVGDWDEGCCVQWVFLN